MKKSHKKPTGTIGKIIISGEGNKPEFVQFDFPEKKDDIEEMIISKSIQKDNPLWKFYELVSSPTQNHENDLDFSLETSTGTELLDLIELAVLGKGGYENASFEYNHGEMADAIIEGIKKKSNHYKGIKANLHLIIYSTDTRFIVGNNILWLVSKFCHENNHGFKTIVYMYLIDNSCNAQIIHPSSFNFNKFSENDLQNIRNRRSLIGDLQAFQKLTDNTVVVKLGNQNKSKNK